jgi:hypothetical protein
VCPQSHTSPTRRSSAPTAPWGMTMDGSTEHERQSMMDVSQPQQFGTDFSTQAHPFAPS